MSQLAIDYEPENRSILLTYVQSMNRVNDLTYWEQRQQNRQAKGKVYTDNFPLIGQFSSSVGEDCETERLCTAKKKKRLRLSLLLLWLFSHELMATMQSVATGQAPITLERTHRN